jgi:outer membrane protein assembly factor BamB
MKNVRAAVLSVVTLALAFGVFGVLGTGCSGRNIHKDLTDDPAVLVRRWAMATSPMRNAGDRGYEFSNPVFFENTLVFGNRSIGLVSLYPSLNQQRWVLPIPNGVISEIESSGGALYFGGGDGYFYSVDADSGRVNWRYEVRNPIVSQPTVAGGRVFFTTTDDTIYALDAGTGKWLWDYRRRSAPTATILGASAPLVDGNEVLAGLSDGFLVAVSVDDGQLKWERRLHNGAKFTDVDAHPVLDNGVIYIPSYDGAPYALKRENGDVIWRMDNGGSKRVVIDKDHLYFPSTDGNVYCLQKNSGKVLWQFELDAGTPTQLSVTDKYVIVGSSFQYLYAISKENGKGVYRFNAGNGSGFHGAPAYDSAQKQLFILSGAGNLYKFDVRKPPRKFYQHGMADPHRFLDFSVR